MDQILQIGIVNDRSVPSLGLHGLHTAFHGLPGVELAALADGLDDGAEAVREQLGARRRYRTMEEMLTAEPIDIVVLCSRNPADHPGQIRTALRHGCHIYCEKPLTTDLAEAAELVRLVDAAGIRFCMAHPGRYAAPFRTIRKLLEAKELGEVLRVDSFGKCDHRGGGEDLMTLGTHLLDLMLFLFGEPERVFAELRTGGKRTPRTERTATMEAVGPCAGEEISAEFRFASGIRGSFFSKKGLFHYNGADADTTNMGVVITGTRGVVSARFTDLWPDFPVRFCRTRHPLAYGDAPLEILPDGDDRTIPGAQELDDAYLRQFPIPQTDFFRRANRFAAWDLIGAIRENREPLSNIHNAYRTLEMLYGIYASHCADRPVSFPLNSLIHPLEQ